MRRRAATMCDTSGHSTGKGSAAVRGAVRRGELLLAGLLRCGHCGRKLYVGYGGKAGRYYCQGALVNHGTERCISFGGLRADHAVGSEVLRVLKPLGINAAVRALEAQTSETSAAKRQLDMALQQARFSAAHARRQYDAVDPANRLVAGELERRWNEALQVVHRIEGEIAALEARKPAPLGEKERRHLLQLGADPVIFGARHGEAVAEPIELLGIDPIDAKTAFQQGFDDRAVGHFDGHPNDLRRGAGAGNQPIAQLLDPQTAMRNGSLAQALSAGLGHAKPM